MSELQTEFDEDGRQFQEEWLSAYLDEELSSDQRLIVEERLAQDPGARRLLEDLRNIRGLVSQLPGWEGPRLSVELPSLQHPTLQEALLRPAGNDETELDRVEELLHEAAANDSESEEISAGSPYVAPEDEQQDKATDEISSADSPDNSLDRVEEIIAQSAQNDAAQRDEPGYQPPESTHIVPLESSHVRASEFESTVDKVPIPVAEVPVAEVPVASEPVVSEPVVSEPVASEPVASEPVASEPVASEPVASEPVASEPVVSEPVVSEPVVSEPVVSEPVVSEPVVSEPVADEPVAPFNLADATESVVTNLDGRSLEPVELEPVELTESLSDRENSVGPATTMSTIDAEDSVVEQASSLGMGLVSETKKTPASMSRWVRPLAMAASLLAIVGIGYGLWTTLPRANLAATNAVAQPSRQLSDRATTEGLVRNDQPPSDDLLAGRQAESAALAPEESPEDRYFALPNAISGIDSPGLESAELETSRPETRRGYAGAADLSSEKAAKVAEPLAIQIEQTTDAVDLDNAGGLNEPPELAIDSGANLNQLDLPMQTDALAQSATALNLPDVELSLAGNASQEAAHDNLRLEYPVTPSAAPSAADDMETAMPGLGSEAADSRPHSTNSGPGVVDLADLSPGFEDGQAAFDVPEPLNREAGREMAEASPAETGSEAAFSDKTAADFGSERDDALSAARGAGPGVIPSGEFGRVGGRSKTAGIYVANSPDWTDQEVLAGLVNATKLLGRRIVVERPADALAPATLESAASDSVTSDSVTADAGAGQSVGKPPIVIASIDRSSAQPTIDKISVEMVGVTQSGLAVTWYRDVAPSLDAKAAEQTTAMGKEMDVLTRSQNTGPSDLSRTGTLEASFELIALFVTRDQAEEILRIANQENAAWITTSNASYAGADSSQKAIVLLTPRQN